MLLASFPPEAIVSVTFCRLSWASFWQPFSGSVPGLREIKSWRTNAGFLLVSDPSRDLFWSSDWTFDPVRDVIDGISLFLISFGLPFKSDCLQNGICMFGLGVAWEGINFTSKIVFDGVLNLLMSLVLSPSVGFSLFLLVTFLIFLGFLVEFCPSSDPSFLSIFFF